MTISDLTVRNAKAKSKNYKISDGNGLHLLVMTNGSRLWRANYRFGGKQRTLSYGPYPQISLAEARSKHLEAKQLMSEGTDPATHYKIEKLKQQVSHANTFGLIADEYLEKLKREDRAPRTLQKNAWLLNFARPYIGDRPIKEINAMEILIILQKVEARGTLETARRLRSIIGTIFRYAMATARVDSDPTPALRGAIATPKVKPRAAITDPKKLGQYLRSVESFEGYTPIGFALKLLPLVFTRPGELREATWNEFDFEACIWTIPGERMKMRRDHRVPLAKQTINLLLELQKISGDHDVLFPSVRTCKRPIANTSMNAALTRLGFTSEEVTPHGFRATASTLLNESNNWNPDAIERQLAHVEENEVRRAYARSDHWLERVQMMQWWADYLEELKATDTVLLAGAA